jgi:WD40 repeat protein
VRPRHIHPDTIGLQYNCAGALRVETGKLLRALEGHSASVWTVAYSADGRLLTSVAADGTLRLWSVAAALRGDDDHDACLAVIGSSPAATAGPPTRPTAATRSAATRPASSASPSTSAASSPASSTRQGEQITIVRSAIGSERGYRILARRIAG